MITEDYCSFEVARLLKEKGFDELCIFKYNSEGVRVKAGMAIDEWQNSELDNDEYSCPSYQMAMKWLREKGWHITIDCIDVTETGLVEHRIDYDNIYEKAVEAALKYALENLI